MSERELMQADWALRDAHREVTLARLALDDLHRGGVGGRDGSLGG